MRSRRKPLLVALAVAVAAAGTATGFVLTAGSGAGHVAARTTSPPPSSSPSAAVSTPVITPSAGPTMAAGAVTWIGPIGFVVPPGWRAFDDLGFGHACLAPVRKRPTFECSGLDVWYGWDSYLPGDERSSYTRDQPAGWYHHTDVQPCPVDPTKGKDGLNGIHTAAPIAAKGLRPLGSRQAYFDEWTATCDSGFRFHPRAWFLPVTNVVVFDYMGYPDTQAVVRTAQYDAGHWLLGLLRGGGSSAAGGETLNVDEAQWLSGPAAERYAHAHGQQDVPNDYILVDDDTSTVRMQLLPTAVVIGNINLGGTEPGSPKRVTVARLLSFVRDRGHWGTPFHIHVDASGRVDRVEEQYRP